MARDIPTTEPDTFYVGTTWEWDKSLGEFPASDGWQLSYVLRCLEAAGSDLSAAWGSLVTADGDTFQVRIPPASTAGKIAGAYELLGEVTDGTKTHLAVHKRVQVFPDPTAATGSKSHAKTMLDAIETAQQGRVLTAEQRRARINGREIEYASDEELKLARAHWLTIVQLERNPGARIRHAGRFVGA